MGQRRGCGLVRCRPAGVTSARCSTRIMLGAPVRGHNGEVGVILARSAQQLTCVGEIFGLLLRCKLIVALSYENWRSHYWAGAHVGRLTGDFRIIKDQGSGPLLRRNFWNGRDKTLIKESCWLLFLGLDIANENFV